MTTPTELFELRLAELQAEAGWTRTADGTWLRNGQPHTNGHHPEPATDVDDEWTPVDIVTIAREIADGTRAREVPLLLEVVGALPLLYPGRTHSIFGLPTGGKTWVALVAIAEQLHKGDPALFIDWEDSPDGTVARLLDLGVPVESLQHLDYISPSTALSYGIGPLTALGADHEWQLVVIDSAGEAMAAAGIDPNADGQVATWMALAKSLTTLPSAPAVLMLDHVPKNGETPATFAIGSQRKLAAISGAAYRCDTLIEPAIGKAGKLRLVVAKDRLGNRAKGTTAAEVRFQPGQGTALTIELHISEAQAAHERGEKFRPTVLMERVSRWLELNPGASVNKIVEGVEGKREFVLSALSVLVEEAWIEVMDGPRNSRLHTMKRAFREDLDALNPVDNPDRGTGSRLVPTGSQEPVVDRCTGSPSPTGEPVTGTTQQPLQTNDRFPPVDNPPNLLEEF
jgi:AAA domain